MRFALLGPLSVRDDAGEPVKVAGLLRRTLLAALLLDADTPVSADRLAALLWDEKVTGTAYAPLHAQLTRLRQALDDEDRVRAMPPGYLIHVEPGELDLQVFAEQCAAGRRKLAGKAWAEASRHFGTALGLWRGRPLADIPVLADDLRIRKLEETHLQALQGRIEAELNLGRHRELLDELGLEPSAELRELHEAVLRADPELLLPPNPNAPRQLPADTRVFTGRAAELTELVTAAGEVARTLVISALDGLGGIGKTALAVHAAHRVADRFPDGQLFIDLRGHSAGSERVQPADALAYLLRSLGVPPQAVPAEPAQRSALYRSRLAESRTLIVLDNAADPEQVRPLLPAEPGCLVLITSRNRLAGLEHARSLTLDILDEQEAVALLGKVAGPRRGPADSPALRELAELCGHLPLALRIVAARLRHSRALTVEDLLAELRDKDVRLGRLTDGERDLTSVFDSSFVHLPEPEQRALRLLGLLPGPDLDAYAAANLLGTDAETAARLLDSLLDHSLLIQQVEGRYSMHDLVRAYARSMIDVAGDETGAASDRLLDYYRHTAAAASRHHVSATRWRGRARADFRGPVPELPELADGLSWLRAERENLLAAIEDAGTSPEQRIDLTCAAAVLLRQDGPWPQAAALHEAAEHEARGLGDRLAQADALRNLGQITPMASLDAAERTQEVLGRALRIYRELGHRQGEADTLLWIGQTSYLRGDPAGARSSYHDALPILREVGDRLGEAQALTSSAVAGQQLGQSEEALGFLHEALAICREIGAEQVEMSALLGLGFLECDLGEFQAATETLSRAVRSAEKMGSTQSVANGLINLGRAHGMVGLHDRARTELTRALGIYEDLGYQFGAAVVLHNLGQARTAAGDLDAAIAHLERCREMLAAAGVDRMQANVERDLGWARHLAGRTDEGRVLLEQALESFRGPVDDPSGEAETLFRLGCVAADTDDPHAALEFFDLALPLALRTHQLTAEAGALDGMARCHERLGERATALDELRRAVALYRRMGTFELAEAESRLAALETAESGSAGAVSEPPAAEVS